MLLLLSQHSAIKASNFSVTALCYYNRKNLQNTRPYEWGRDTKEKQSMKKGEVNEHKCENNFYPSSPLRTARAIKMCHECFMDKFIKTSTAILKWNFDYKLRHETLSTLLCLHYDTFGYTRNFQLFRVVVINSISYAYTNNAHNLLILCYPSTPIYHPLFFSVTCT